jgi:spore coat protein H
MISLLTLPNSLHAQPQLQLVTPDDAAIHEIAFTLDPKKLKQLHVVQGKKIPYRIDTLYLNKSAVPAEFIRIRGSSSSHFYRKSFTIHLAAKAALPGTNKPRTNKLYAVSMNMDRNYIRNVIAYRVLSRQGLLSAPHTYANLLINQQSEGLYLVVYPSAEYALKECGASVVIRRGYESTVRKTYTRKSATTDSKPITQLYTSIYKKMIPVLSGEALYQELSGALNLNHYFTWMAFNHLFQNGDYSDEVYFLWQPELNRFDIMPWDFDDLFQTNPHEQPAKGEEKPFLFSTEDKLDATIANDPYLYRKYLEAYRKFLYSFTTADLKEVLESVYRDVIPYYSEPSILSMSTYDKYGKTDLAALNRDLNNIYSAMHARIELLRQQLDGILR